MTLLFNRKAIVTYGKRGQAGTRVSGLRVVFGIEKDSLSSSNKAQISIFNLSHDHAAAMKEPDSVIMLDVGYGENIEQLFIGDITTPTTGRSGADWVTIIDAGDGQVALETATIDKAYMPGTKYSTVARDVIDKFKEAGQVIVTSVYDTLRTFPDRIQSGMSLSGQAVDLLDVLMGKLGAEWSIQDNEVMVLRPSEDTGEEAVLLTPETGLIGSPVVKKESVEVTALIQANIKPGRLIDVRSRFLNGIYKVDKAKYVGDTHGAPWYVTAEGISR